MNYGIAVKSIGDYADGMWFRFRWETTNLANIAKHGLTPADVEDVVNRAVPPYPLEVQDAFKVCGPTKAGKWIEVLYEFDPMPTEIELLARSDVEPDDDELSRILAIVDALRFAEPAVYVFHARPLQQREATRAQSRLREIKR